MVELLVVIVLTSIIMSVLASAFIVGADTISSANSRLQESHDAQLATAYFTTDVDSATYFSTSTRPPSSSTCRDAASGETDVALFEWTESGTGTLKDAFYFLTGSPQQLHRRYCENSVQLSNVSIARSLDPAKPPVVTCPLTGAQPCSTQPAEIQLQVWEASGYSFTFRATRRTDRSAGSAMDGISAYVGSGGVNAAIGSTFGAVSGIVDVNSSSLTCAGTFTHPAGLLEGNPSPAPAPSCGATATNPQPDPLASLPGFSAPPAALPPVGGGSSATFHDGQSLGPIFYMGAWYNVYTSGSAMFTAADVGRTITGTGILPSTTIVAVQDPYVGLSTTDASGPSGQTFTIVGRGGGIPTMTPCGFVGEYYQPGTYASWTAPTARGCLGTGTYDLPGGTDLANLTSAGTFTDGSPGVGPLYTSGTAAFTSADVGMSIVGPNIRAGTTIGSVTNSSTVVLSTPATGAGTFTILDRDGQYSDGGATSGSKVYTSPTAIFTSGLVGKSIVGTHIPPGTTISSVTNSSTVVLSNPATGVGAGLTFTVFDRSGVLIHVAGGALTLASDNFGPATIGPDAGVTIWMGAGAAGITVTNSATVNGIIYAPNGTLSVSGSLFPNVNLTAGAVDVKAINLAANTSLTLS